MLPAACAVRGELKVLVMRLAGLGVAKPTWRSLLEPEEDATPALAGVECDAPPPRGPEGVPVPVATFAASAPVGWCLPMRLMILRPPVGVTTTNTWLLRLLAPPQSAGDPWALEGEPPRAAGLPLPTGTPSAGAIVGTTFAGSAGEVAEPGGPGKRPPPLVWALARGDMG